MLDPGWTTYDHTVLYAVHDVTDLLTADGKLDHAVGVELGNGWWNPMTLKMWGHVDVRNALTVLQGRGNGSTTEPMFRPVRKSPLATKNLLEDTDGLRRPPLEGGRRNPSVTSRCGSPLLLLTCALLTTSLFQRLKIVATLTDGSQQTILTSKPASAPVSPAASAPSSSWVAGGSPTRFNNIYLGEKYDATLDAHYRGWSSIGYESSSWTPAVLAGTAATLSLGDLEPQVVPPIRKLCSRTGTCDEMGNATCASGKKCPWSKKIPGVLDTTVVSTTRREDANGNSTIVLDAGKNHAGVCRFRLNGGAANAGKPVYIRYGELLGADKLSLNPMTSVAGQIKGPTELPCIVNPGQCV